VTRISGLAFVAAFDNMGRVSEQTNPTEINGSWIPTGDDVYVSSTQGGWRSTLQAYDWKGRPTVTTNSDGTQRIASYGGCGCAGGEITTAQDEHGRQRRSTKDTLGRLVKVEELNWGGSVYATTNYSYNGVAWGWNRGYVYVGSQLLAVKQGGVNWMHEDPVTKSKRVTNSSGAIVSTIELDPWGASTSRNVNSAFQPRKFTSYTNDLDGCDEAMMRRYGSSWSRFSQPDPDDGSYDFGNPQSFNRYACVQGDPVNFTDPSGLFACLTCPDEEDGRGVSFLVGSMGCEKRRAGLNPTWRLPR
jgi:RHS repeat-associated protein